MDYMQSYEKTEKENKKIYDFFQFFSKYSCFLKNFII